MRSNGWLLAVSAVLIAAATGSGHAGEKTPSHVVETVWSHLGGRAAYEKARVLEFVWVVEKDGAVVAARRHLWDRYTGAYVLGTRDKETGDSLDVYMDVHKKTGTVLRNGVPLGDEDSPKHVENAYAAHINDSYWLVSPTKLEDPGVELSVAESDSATGLAVLHLSFEKVGLTPGDQYWLYVADDGRIGKWRFLLEGGREGVFDWCDEKDCGMAIRLSTNKVSADGTLRIYFPFVKFAAKADPARFAAPVPR